MRHLLLFLLLPINLVAQRTDWIYYTSTHGSNLRNFTKVDSEGSTITAVEFSSTITVNGTLFGSGGSESILLIKVLPSGEVDWAKQFGSTGDQFVGSLAVDQEDRIYLLMAVSGFHTSFTADDTLLTLPSVGERTVLVRVSPDGDVDRARVGGVGWAMDAAGNDLYCIQSITPGTTHLQRLNSDLELVSSVQLGTLEALNYMIEADPAGYIAVAASEFTADAMEIQGTAVPNDATDQNEAFVMLLNLEGELQWVRSFGAVNTIPERVYGLAVADDGRVFVATASDTSLTFAGASFPEQPPYYPQVGFLLAFAADGSEDFAIPAYSLYDQVRFWDVIVDDDGNIVATADIVSSGLVNGIQIPAAARPYGLIKLDPQGNMLWLKHPFAGSNTMSAAAFDLGQGPDGAYYLGGFGQWFRVDCSPTTTPGWRYFTMRIVEEDPILPEAAFSWSATGGEVQFTNTSTNATSASWSFGDGSTSTALDPLYTYAGPGVYEVILTASNGPCLNRDTMDVNILSTRGPEVTETHEAFELFPNPASDQVLVRSGKVISGLRLFDITGRKVSIPSDGVGSKTVRLDVSGMMPGRYLLECITPEGPAVRTLTVR
ncbi:MAG: PKD domain-containing protein [Flavobacteriales bacterium]|nr:PKD domain-containing protein [Flavobacteriales bacterium]